MACVFSNLLKHSGKINLLRIEGSNRHGHRQSHLVAASAPLPRPWRLAHSPWIRRPMAAPRGVAPVTCQKWRQSVSDSLASKIATGGVKFLPCSEPYRLIERRVKDRRPTPEPSEAVMTRACTGLAGVHNAASRAQRLRALVSCGRTRRCCGWLEAPGGGLAALRSRRRRCRSAGLEGAFEAVDVGQNFCHGFVQ